jgi:hypothetical protein
VPQEVRVEPPHVGLLADAGEELAKAVAREALPRVGRKERIGVSGVVARAQVALQLSGQRDVEVDHPGFLALAGHGPHGHLAGSEVEVTDTKLARLVEAEPGSREEDDESVVAAAGASGGEAHLLVIG